MKIQFFVRAAGPSDEDLLVIKRLREKGNKVMLSNGDFKKGFQTSCDAVYLSCDFTHVEKWAATAGIEVMKPESNPEPKPEPVKTKPAAKRGPKPKAKPEPTEPVTDDEPTDEEGAE